MMSPVNQTDSSQPGAPPIVDEDALLEDLVYALRICGHERFFSCPILIPTTDYFPDSWLPNEAGLKIITQRLMDYAGLASLKVEVEIFTDREALAARRSAQGETHHGAAAYFMGIENRTALFACETSNLAKAESLIATMGHEVAHAFRAYHGVVVSDRQREEELTDLTAVYLGFGVFSCNASRTYTKSGTQRGAATVTRESTSRLGYLPPRAFAFIFACQLASRGKPRETRQIRSYLAPVHRQYFDDALRDLKRNRSLLLTELGVTETEVERLTASVPNTAVAPAVTIDDELREAFRASTKTQIPTCPQCGEEIDYKLKQCPHCNATLPTRMHWPSAIIMAIIGIAFALWLSWP